MHTERRLLRSEYPSNALRIFLAKNANSPGVRAAVVGSDEGMLLAGVGDDDLDVLAAVGSVADAGQDVTGPCEQLGWSADALFTQRLKVGERDIVVTSLGGPLAAANDIGGLLGRLLA
ncbi:MAG: hypothetical protein KUG77_28805 [Nannocystaceae bacterium]|nr:hypothetical protein [Nannocystaceae bacterium]